MIERSKVMWAGVAPTLEINVEHQNRGLNLVNLNLSHFDKTGLDYTYARGLIICAMAPMMVNVKKVYSAIPDALDHGLLILILLGDSLAHSHVKSEIEKIVPIGPARDLIRYRIGAPAHEVAEIFARHLPGPAINTKVRIEGPTATSLTSMQRFLLQRAFSDCSAIELTELSGGRSALALAVKATLIDSLAGPHPLPFFAKLDRAKQIADERQCYERYAETHLAWYLRPNLQSSRCLLGSDSGILVGCFVPNSESLWSLICQDLAEGPIQSLFNETLSGWRDPRAVASTETGPIAPSMEPVFSYLAVRKCYLEMAKEFGFGRDPQEVWEEFLNLPSRAWPKAPIHGDMHAENVRIRGGDAIVIDLAKVSMGPCGADPASMEVWIGFEAPLPGFEVSQAEWLHTVRELFAYQYVVSPPITAGIDSCPWLRNGVLHTRHVALRSCPPQDYAITLALYLVRRATFDPDVINSEADKFRRTWAWILGCQLLEGILTSLNQSSIEETA